MSKENVIPIFELFGEEEAFPDILHCEPFSRRAGLHGWRIAPHRHVSLSQLIIVLEGEAQVQIDGQEILLRAGKFLFIPQQLVHGFTFVPHTKGHVMSFAPSVFKTICAPPATLQSAFRAWFSDDISQDLGNIIAQFVKLGNRGGALRKAQRIALAHAILALISQTLWQEGQRPEAQLRLANFERLIDEHICDRWTASDYAAALCLTTGHLSRLCRQENGIGAAAFIEQKTCAEACRMLAFTSLSISQIAYHLGFPEPTYFSRKFRKLRGETPSQYRARFVI